MRKKIRLLGVVLIAGGYIWQLLWLANAVVPLPRSIFREADEKYSPAKTYSRSEVLDAVAHASGRWGDNSLIVIISSNLMLLGGILIHRGAKVIH